MKESTLACLRAYADERVPPGGFLEAVLSNDLRSAVSRADPENLSDLKAIVEYCHWEIPGDCWGSIFKVEAWLTSRPPTPHGPR